MAGGETSHEIFLSTIERLAKALDEARLKIVTLEKELADLSGSKQLDQVSETTKSKSSEDAPEDDESELEVGGPLQNTVSPVASVVSSVADEEKIVFGEKQIEPPWPGRCFVPIFERLPRKRGPVDPRRPKKFCFFFNNCTAKCLFTEELVSQLTVCDASAEYEVFENFSMDLLSAILNDPKRRSVYVTVFSHVLVALSIKRGRADQLRDTFFGILSTNQCDKSVRAELLLGEIREPWKRALLRNLRMCHKLRRKQMVANVLRLFSELDGSMFVGAQPLIDFLSFHGSPRFAVTFCRELLFRH
ncbi:hypothetical protein QR680_008316 [Steinernema hermaphroditum]|uniref:Uncharacterized protein n=1 Tax=Steinernema hermaphroditum TaxID=289476 RepID=A0AA39II82_9BILA|nr:hypothetical protein QR680_008316 [Steinernema hermaphroditum]